MVSFLEIGDACVVHTDCEDLGTNVQCNSLRCTEVSQSDSESSKTVLDVRTYTSTLSGTNTNAGTTSTNSHTKTDIGNEKSPSTDGTSQFSKSSSSSTSGTSKDTLALVNGRSDLNDTDSEHETEQVEQAEAARAGDKRKSREIAVQTSIDALELKPLAPLVKNVGTGTTSSTSSRRISRYSRRRQSAFHYDDEDKTFSTISNTDDDAEDKQCKFIKKKSLLYFPLSNLLNIFSPSDGSSCTENGKVCAGLPHSICSHNICFCRSGYYPNNGKCFAGELAKI